MKEVIRTNDLVKISKIESILLGAGIQYKLFDVHASILEGTINAIEKRVMVSNNNYEYALRLIKDQSIEIKYD